MSAVNLLDSPGLEGGEGAKVTTTPLRIFTSGGDGLADYDDLPPEHKPVLPPKAPQQTASGLFQKRSTGNLHLDRAGQLDPVQLALHAQVMSKSAHNLSPTSTVLVNK